MPDLSPNSTDCDNWMVPTYAPAPFTPVRAIGSQLWDSNGKDYIDLAGGIAVNALGHNHPQLAEALQQQSQQFWHVSNLMVNQPALTLARNLCQRTFAEAVFFANSGAEANEAALKLARRWQYDRGNTEQYEILAFDGAFHGRTLFTVAVGGQEQHTRGFGPTPAGHTACSLQRSQRHRSCGRATDRSRHRRTHSGGERCPERRLGLSTRAQIPLRPPPGTADIR